jgi:hypothetical protein
MNPSELASSVAAVLVGRDGAVRVSITDDWHLHVHGVSYSVGVKLPEEQRSRDGAVAAIRAVAPWAVPWAIPQEGRPPPSTRLDEWPGGKGSGH